MLPRTTSTSRASGGPRLFGIGDPRMPPAGRGRAHYDAPVDRPSHRNRPRAHDVDHGRDVARRRAPRIAGALVTRPTQASAGYRSISRSLPIGPRRSWRRRVVRHRRSTMERRPRRSSIEAPSIWRLRRGVSRPHPTRCTGTRPRIPTAPAWRLFAHGPVSDLIPGRVADSPLYLAAWIADDPSDGDRDPGADANGRLLIRATAFGSGGARRSVEATVARVGPPGSAGRPSAVRMVAWRELR